MSNLKIYQRGNIKYYKREDIRIELWIDEYWSFLRRIVWKTFTKDWVNIKIVNYYIKSIADWETLEWE